MTKQYMTVEEVADAMGVSEGKTYAIIRQLNKELKELGYITVQERVSRVFFEERCCYGGVSGKAAGGE